jgi:iron complex transport system substrate-binding protein
MKHKVLWAPVFLLVLGACRSAVAPATTAPTLENGSAIGQEPAATVLMDVPPAAILTDGLGREIVLDELPERVVIAGRAAQLILHAAFFFDEADARVVAMEQRTQRGASMMPLVDSAYAGVIQLERDASAEAIAAARPDAVLLKSYLAESLGAPLETLGLTTIYLDLETPEQFFRDVRVLGASFGDPERAEEVLAFYQERLDLVSRAVATIPAEERPRVLLLQYTDRGGEVAVNVPPAEWLQTILVELAGGEPVWLDVAGSSWTIVDLEQIAAWDPDYVFVVYYGGDPAPASEALRADGSWAALRAVREGHLLAFPGDFVSWDQPDPRWILGLEWLASRLLPEGSFPFDARAEMQAFYGHLYGLDQTVLETEIMPLLNGDYES